MTDTEVPFRAHSADDPSPATEDRIRERVTAGARRRRARRRTLTLAVPAIAVAVAVAVVATRQPGPPDAVVADAPAPSLAVEPNYQWDIAKLSDDGLTLSLFVGSYPPGTGPCAQNFDHDVVETDDAVTIGIVEVVQPPPTTGTEDSVGLGCEMGPRQRGPRGAALSPQRIEVTLRAPLGDRPVFDGLRAAPRRILRLDSLVEVTHVPDGFTAAEPSLESDAPSQQTFENPGADWYFAVNQVDAESASEFYGDEHGTPVDLVDIEDAELITGQMSGTMETIRFPVGDLVVSVWGEMQGPPSFTHRDELLRIAEGIRLPTRTAPAIPPTTSSDGGQDADPPPDDRIEDPIVPALVGRTTDEAFELLRNAGFLGRPALVQSRYVASDSVPAGTIAAQDIAAGTTVVPTIPIPIEVSAGGPAIEPSDLPQRALTHLQGLDGFDPAEPVLVVTTPSGAAYKVDRWLFGPCPSVTAAYRTFSDPEYGDSCY